MTSPSNLIKNPKSAPHYVASSPDKKIYSSQLKSYQGDDLMKLVDEKDSKNTINGNQHAATLFERYLIENGHMKTCGDDDCADLKPIDWAVMDSSDLDHILSRFYAETRSLKGEKYKRTSMLAIRGGLNRYMNMIRRHKKMEEIDLARDSQFTESNSMFKAVGKVLKIEGKASIDHNPPVELKDLKKMQNYFTKNIEMPTVLQQAVFVYVVNFFIRKGRDDLRQLKVNDFAVTSDADGDLYLYKNTDEQTKNHQDDINKKEARIYQKKDNDVLCPVRTFLNYKRKLNPRGIFLFQRPKKEITAQHKVWYDPSPVGVKLLGSMMPTISTAAYLSKVYTNHSLRATTITLLDDAKEITAQDKVWYNASPVSIKLLGSMMPTISTIAHLPKVYTNNGLTATTITLLDGANQLLCYWPPVDAKTKMNVCEIPNKEDWKKNSARMIGESCYSSNDDACKDAEQIDGTSIINTNKEQIEQVAIDIKEVETNNPCRKRKIKRYLSENLEKAEKIGNEQDDDKDYKDDIENPAIPTLQKFITGQIKKDNFKEYSSNFPTYLSSQYILPTDEIQSLNSKDHLESQGCISSTNVDVGSGSPMRFHSNLGNNNQSKDNEDCGCKCCSKVLSKLENLESMLLEMRNKLFKQNQGNIDSSFTLLNILPGGKAFSTKEEFEAFDRQLNNELFSKKLIQLLSVLEGGQDVEKITHTIMRTVLSNAVMSFYSNVDQKGKLSFKITNFYHVVSEAIMKSCGERIKEIEIISEIGAVLKKAPNQPGGINYNEEREIYNKRNKRLKNDQEHLPSIVKYES